MQIPFSHQSVMANEIMSLFKDAQKKNFVDATAGGGGHLAMLAELVGPHGKVLAFDKDPRAHHVDAALGVAQKFADRVLLFHRPFSHIKRTLTEHNLPLIDGIICDLGVSSNQIDDKSRGFSFMVDGPIDMRMDTTSPLTAYNWLQNSREEDIADALFTLGGERKSRAIARAIKKSWPIENSTLALAQLILSAMRQRSWSKIHPATRSFQAIRMAVNQEETELIELLTDLPSLLAVGGVAAFLSFHSVEDRLIKNAFKKMAQSHEGPHQFLLLTKKPLIASAQEVLHNRRARSAKLRAIVRIS